LAKAYKCGIPVSIYRPSWIIGAIDNNTYSLENNHLFLFLKGCIQMGYAPKLNAKLSMLPVDFVSSFIVKASINNKINAYVIFNLFNPLTVRWSTLIQKFNDYGCKISLTPPIVWYKNYLSKIDGRNSAYPLMPLCSDGGISWAKSQNIFLKVNTKSTESAINTLKLKHKMVDDFFIMHCLDFFRKDCAVKFAT